MNVAAVVALAVMSTTVVLNDGRPVEIDVDEAARAGLPADPETLVRRSGYLTHEVFSSDVLTPGGPRELEVVALGERRGPAAVARTLYIDHTPAPPPKDKRSMPSSPIHWC